MMAPLFSPRSTTITRGPGAVAAKHQQSSKAKFIGSIFMGCIYGAVAFLLFHWHALLHSTAENAAVTRTIIQQQQAQQQQKQRFHNEDIEESPDVLGGQAGEKPFVRTMNHTERLTERPEKPIVVAYAISVIKCGDFQTTATGLIDAALVLRHSIHETSSRVGVSKYDYKMYAFVHKGAQQCSQILQDLGFTTILRGSPVSWKEIGDPFLRNNIAKEWCCGAKEFIKLYAYTLGEPLVVHLDIDFVMHKPLDTVFDVLLYDKDSAIGRKARAAVEVERKQSADEVIVLPDNPQAAFTRDWGQVVPGRRSLFQAGFLVARTNPQVTQDVVEIIRTEKFVDPNDPDAKVDNGWGGLGYGAYVGAMAMQGLMAFYYDQHVPGTWIELNQCRYNHMGMDAKMRGEPNFVLRKRGRCRNKGPYCEDCKITPMDQIYNIHYTQCRKPWLCINKGNENIPRIVRQRTRMDKLLLPVHSINVPHCLELAQIWHDHRSDLETKLTKLTGDTTIDWGRNGTHSTDVFHGHCSELGPQGYLAIRAKPESLLRLKELYDN